MLATAVALQPRHLVVAGVDLFNHPAGAYPGDAVTPNAYTAAHEPGTELALLLEALSLYEGDLTILSPALRERWKEFQSGRGGHRETGGEAWRVATPTRNRKSGVWGKRGSE